MVQRKSMLEKNGKMPGNPREGTNANTVTKGNIEYIRNLKSPSHVGCAS